MSAISMPSPRPSTRHKPVIEVKDITLCLTEHEMHFVGTVVASGQTLRSSKILRQADQDKTYETENFIYRVVDI